MKLAIVASGWHYPLHFYEEVAKQQLPEGWTMDLFVVSHRDPKFSKEEKKGKVLIGERGKLDRKLYKSMASIKKLEALGWKYMEKPNTIGDWGNSNQWLEDYNYKDYDLLLFTHDDNLILNRKWFWEIIKDESFNEWEVLANSDGMPSGWIRGSCEFFKPSFIEKIGGKFDLGKVSLTREGETTATEDVMELNDWNNTVHPLMDFIMKNDIKVGYLSPSYRVSMFVIEGERGYISNTHGINTEKEETGLAFLKQHGII